MLHPHTELRFVSEKIGYGVFATKDIPRGTITWVKDELDRLFTQAEVDALSGPNLENLLKYTYRNRHGHYYFCWDLTRYTNHSYDPNCILTAMGFEIATKDIRVGEEITNDYGTFNIIEEFECANGPHEREFVRPDDLTRFYPEWDALISSAMKFQNKVDQPLAPFLTSAQLVELQEIHTQRKAIPSIIENYFKG